MSDIPTREAAIHMYTGNRVPITLIRGEGTRIWDSDGKEYLDFIAGISSDTLGHGDAGLAEAISEQARTLIHVSNIFYSEPQIELGEMLIANSVLDRVFFCNSGAEANEAAIKLARKWGIQNRDGGYEIISTNNSFHGRTLATVSATGTAAYREPFGPPTPGFVFVDYDNMEQIREATTPQTAAIMLEPVQGEGGVNVPTSDYLQQVRVWCDEQGILLILDEIQTGMGRSGMLWAYEQAGIEPDIMTSAKGLAGGVPIGAVLAKEHASVFVPGDHGSTFGGNPLATAAGAHVMRRLLEGGVLANAKARGAQLQQRLAGLQDRHVLVSGERGIGLLRGLELSSDVAVDVANAAREAGLLVNPVRPDLLRFMPPLTVAAAEIDQAVAIVEEVLDSIEQN
jgi:acetylornithine/N-succinyldiaminopimelate aminotransferase